MALPFILYKDSTQGFLRLILKSELKKNPYKSELLNMW